MLLGFFTISGHSMMPTLPPGDKIFVSALPYLFRPPQENDIVAFRVDGKVMVKRIVQIKDGRIIVAGDNVKDSLSLSPIMGNHIMGKVVFRLSV